MMVQSLGSVNVGSTSSFSFTVRLSLLTWFTHGPDPPCRSPTRMLVPTDNSGWPPVAILTRSDPALVTSCSPLAASITKASLVLSRQYFSSHDRERY